MATDKGENKETGSAQDRGLPSISQAREERRKMRRPTARIILWLVLIFAVIGIIQWKFSQGELEEQRQALLAKQRAAEAELGKRWFPLRDNIEQWTQDLARSPGEEVIDEEVLSSWDFQEMPGLYLRLSVEQAQTSEDIRTHAKESARDGFAACLLTVENKPGLDGPECERTKDCAPGLVCNEAQRCAEPTQPYNLRIAYRTLSVLSGDFTEEVQEASTDLRVKLLEGMFEDATVHDFPIAADVLTQAKYFLVVLDEKPVGKDGPDRTDKNTYPARIGVWRLSDGKNVVRVRRTVEAELKGAPAADPVTEGARIRQANSCALAHDLRRLIGDASVPKLPTMAPNPDGPDVDDPEPTNEDEDEDDNGDPDPGDASPPPSPDGAGGAPAPNPTP